MCEIDLGLKNKKNKGWTINNPNLKTCILLLPKCDIITFDDVVRPVGHSM